MIESSFSFDRDTISGVLMIGQSNMAGRGEFGEVEPIENDRCFMLRMGRWRPMSEPINPDRAIFGSKLHSGVGLAASFADSFSKRFDTKVGLIPCADGGTKLEQWMPGEVLYEHAVFMTRLALRECKLKAIIWHQGESDCTADETVDTYTDRFVKMITSLRKDLNAENVPLIIGEISEDIAEWWNTMGRQKRFNEIVGKIPEVLPLCGAVSAKGLKLKDDGIHFCSESCRELGNRYFEKYIEVLNRSERS